MNYKVSVTVLPVINELVCDSLNNELAVPLQGVECVLDRLVDSFLDGATNLLDLVDAAAWLTAGRQTEDFFFLNSSLYQLVTFVCAERVRTAER